MSGHRYSQRGRTSDRAVAMRANQYPRGEGITSVRLAQDVLPPLAVLHRPETGEGEMDVLHYAMFYWVPVNAEKPNHAIQSRAQRNR